MGKARREVDAESGFGRGLGEGCLLVAFSVALLGEGNWRRGIAVCWLRWRAPRGREGEGMFGQGWSKGPPKLG